MKKLIAVVAVLFIVLAVVVSKAWHDGQSLVKERERAAAALGKVATLEGKMQVASQTIVQSEKAHAIAAAEAAAQKKARVALERDLAALKAHQPILPPVVPDTCAPWAAAVAAKDSIIRVADAVIASTKNELTTVTNDNAQLVSTLGVVRGVLADSTHALADARAQLLKKATQVPKVGLSLRSLLPTINVGIDGVRYEIIEKKFSVSPAASVQLGWRIRF